MGAEMMLPHQPHTAADSLIQAGFAPLAVTRSAEVRALMARENLPCILHDGPLKADAMRVGLQNLPPNAAGFLFMPADQPLTLPDSLRRLAAQFLENPTRATRLGYGDTPGSPVLFPAACRNALLAYRGDRGGADVLKSQRIPCDIVQVSHPWELWDVDTPEGMERVRNAL
jgi:molybdenum cofactor cytidylyltransferase